MPRVDKNCSIIAAIDDMESNGRIAIDVEELVKKLRITKGSFYNYFKSSDDLIHAALEY